MLRRSQPRNYWHNVSKDLVPEGFRASRFQSNHTPHQRFNTQLEYALSPAFGGTSSGEYFPLVTLAVGENCTDPTAFAKRYRKGLSETLNEIAKVEQVVYRIKYASDDANAEDSEKKKKLLQQHYKKYNKFYQITTGLILRPGETPWGYRNKEKMRNEELAPSFNSLLNQINRNCLGVEVYLNICTSRNKLRGDRKVNPDNWIETDDKNNQKEEETETKEEEADISTVLELEERDLENDLKIFSELQRNLLENANNKTSSSLSPLLLRHNIRHCFPGHLPHPMEHAIDQYMGVEVSDKSIDDITARWRERVAKFG